MTPDPTRAPPKSRCGRCGLEDYTYEMFRSLCLGCTGEEMGVVRELPVEKQKPKALRTIPCEFTRLQKLCIIRQYVEGSMTVNEITSIHRISPVRMRGWIRSFRMRRLYDDGAIPNPKNSTSQVRLMKLQLLGLLNDEEVQE